MSAYNSLWNVQDIYTMGKTEKFEKEQGKQKVEQPPDLHLKLYLPLGIIHNNKAKQQKQWC
jgi:hypothetical protein